MAEKGQAKGNSDTVTVACKLPHGLVLRLFKMNPITEAVIGGGTRETTKAEEIGGGSERVTINGYAAPFGELPKGEVIGGRLGYALTHGVNRAFFEEWLKQNKDSDVVKKGFIFAADSRASAVDQAKDQRGLVNGLEPLDPEKLPRLSKNLRVETATKEEAA